MNDVEKFRSKVNKELRSGLYSLIVLSVIERKGPIHGYKIIQYIKNKTDSELNPKDATVYPLLRSLQKKGLLSAFWSEAVNGPPKKCYELTEEGVEALQYGLEDWRELTKIANDLFQMRGEKDV